MENTVRTQLGRMAEAGLIERRLPHDLGRWLAQAVAGGR